MKKLFAILLAAAMLGGCAEAATADASTSENPAASVVENAQSEKETVKEQKDSNMVFGKVTAIDGTTITLLTVRGGPNQRPDKDAGRQNKQRSSSDAAESADSQRSEIESSPSGQQKNRPSRGNPPDRDDQRELKGEEKTITVADECRILIEKEGETSEGALTDIKVENIICVDFADDGTTPTTITVRTDSFGKQGGRPGDKGSAESQSTDSSPK